MDVGLFRMLAQVNGDPGAWHKEVRYGDGFYARRSIMTDAELAGMRDGGYWLATRGPADGTTDRISVDIDCDSDANLPERDRNYQVIRETFGVDRVPLVFSTPSGRGLRLLYRIPRTELSLLVVSPTRGVVADVLAASGAAVRAGSVEVYPQANHVDRMVLGPRMPFRDPDTLDILEAPSASTAAGLALLSDWHRQVLDDIVPTLQTLWVPAPASPDVRDSEAGAPTSDAIRIGTRLLAAGLEEPGSRHRSEFIVAMALCLAVAGYPALGLPPNPSSEAIARAVALWLSRFHNGLSKEWTLHARRGTAAGIQYWTERYLTKDTRGQHMIDRARQIAWHFTGLGGARLTTAERSTIMAIAESRYTRAGVERYRFEVWTAALLRCIRSTLAYYARKGRKVEPRARADGHMEVVLEIGAERMQSWAFGSRYTEYREVMVEAGLMSWATPYVHRRYQHQLKGLPDPGQELANVATGYRVPVPDDGPPSIVVPASALKATCLGLQRHGTRLSVDELMHALFLAGSGEPLEHRYGRRTHDHVRRLVAAYRRACGAI